jgi:diguanylate cyclase (GGDEF)-like protein
MDDLEQLKIENQNLRNDIAELIIKNDYLDGYYQSILSGSIFKFEVDFTANELLSDTDMLPPKTNYHDFPYSKLIKERFLPNIVENNAKDVESLLKAESIIEIFSTGKRQITIDYQACMGLLSEEPMWFRLKLYLMSHPVSGHICGLISISNIDATKTMELEIADKAQHDPLTGLYNRYTMEKLVNQALHEKNCVHAFLIFDLDNFKNANDTYGHLSGDSILVQFSNILTKQFRKTDIVARIGGDEFTVLMKSISLQTVLMRANEVIRLCKTITVDGNLAGIGVSTGISFYPENGNTIHDLFTDADKALYASKNQGKGIATIYSEELISSPELDPPL